MVLALAAVLLLSVWSIWQAPDDDESAGGAQAAPAPASRHEAPAVDIVEMARASWRGHLRALAGTPVAGDPFGMEQAAPPPMPQTSTRAPAAGNPRQPRAAEPAPELQLPYVYLGKLEKDGVLDVYLDNGSAPLVARAGQNLPGGWRFDGVEAGALAFTHLPSNQKKMLSLKVNQ